MKRSFLDEAACADKVHKVHINNLYMMDTLI